MSNYSDAIDDLAPLAYWRLGEASGETIAVDETGNYDATYLNAPSLEQPGLLVSDVDTAVVFDNSTSGDDGQCVKSDAIIGVESIRTYHLIINSTDISVRQCIVHCGDVGLSGNQGFNCIVDAGSGEIKYYTLTTGYISTGFIITPGTTYHIVITIDSTNVKFYVDSVLEFTHAVNITGLISHTSLYIGCLKCNSSYCVGLYVTVFNGTIDDVAIFSDVLTQSEITNLYEISIDPHKAFNITIDHTKVDEDLYDFPILVNLGVGSGIDDFDSRKIFDNLNNSDPNEIKKLNVIYINPADNDPPDNTPADSTVHSKQCKTEINRWDQANSEAQLWVKIPYISKDVDTTISLSYNPENADNSANVGYTGEMPAQLVWTEYDAVYHLSADGSDSTANAFDGSLVNIDGANVVDFGIGKGLIFNGVDEHISLSADNLLQAYTISLIIELADIIGIKSLIDGVNGGWHVNGDKLSYDLSSDGTNNLLAATLYDINLLQNGESGTTYINGELSDSLVSSAVDLIVDSIATETSVPANWFNGKLKEVRFSKSLKTPSWISTNYNSIQDSLALYSGADAYVLTKSIPVSIAENVAVVDWIIRAYRLDNGILTAELKTIAGVFELPIPNDQWYPSMVTIAPDQGVSWVGSTAQFVDDLIFPTDPKTTPYYFKCTVSGTGVDGVTDLTEPAWPVVPGQTVIDGTVTWEVVERMIQPVTHSPMIPA